MGGGGNNNQQQQHQHSQHSDLWISNNHSLRQEIQTIQSGYEKRIETLTSTYQARIEDLSRTVQQLQGGAGGGATAGLQQEYGAPDAANVGGYQQQHQQQQQQQHHQHTPHQRASPHQSPGDEMFDSITNLGVRSSILPMAGKPAGKLVAASEVDELRRGHDALLKSLNESYRDQMNRHVTDLARARSDLSRHKAEHDEQLQRVVNRYEEERHQWQHQGHGLGQELINLKHKHDSELGRGSSAARTRAAANCRTIHDFSSTQSIAPFASCLQQILPLTSNSFAPRPLSLSGYI